jgi:hypothetical protein
MHRVYAFLCGNLDCPSRQEPYLGEIGRRFAVPAEELPDGEVWVCNDCLRKQTLS